MPAAQDRLLALLRELELADREVAEVLAELDDLTRRVESVRLRALELERLFVRLPAERAQVAAGVERAELEREAATAALAEVETSVRAAGEGNPAARRFEVRARDRLSAAERRASEAARAVGELEHRAQEADDESARIEVEARALAEALRGRPRLAEDAGADPAPGLAGVAGWGSGAGAALFVARAQLATERDAVVRQANELGALALGEPLTASSAAVVGRRVRERLRG